ncbi:hypothetical protein [Geminisphaera colitermitum]|uniref:hypothetical protein n=1 Tax=Geminisphaera colitermitum TaxID=1148786 RepID=UPI0006935A5A|nr:hypothetical protein [Geminisphaera colitermitum]
MPPFLRFLCCLIAAINPLAKAAPLTLAPNPDWSPITHTTDIVPGAVFDFSRLNTTDTPAGRHGPIIVTPQGHFAFANRPDTRVRFWGVNLCFDANYPTTPDEAEQLAARLSRSGYNTVRLHHFDRDLAPPPPPATGSTNDALALNPERLAQLDTLFAALKRHGIYINIDLYSLRRPSPHALKRLGIDPSGDIPAQFKTLIPLSDEAFDEWARFARQLLTHRNPHTGLTWAEDPALIGICPVNEDPLTAWIDRAPPTIRKRYDDAFTGWLAANDTTPNDNTTTTAPQNRDAAFNRFLHELHIRSDARLHAHLRSLGTHALLTGANFQRGQALSTLRCHYDYVDNHQYWDHPKRITGNWRLPFGFHQKSATAEAAATPRLIMPTRIIAKPFVVSEFNYVRPNHHRAEAALLMPAYASLQDWDALYRFDYATTRESVHDGGFIGTFALADDPLALLADRVAALIFRRGDISPARHLIAFAPDPTLIFTQRERPYPDIYSRIGLISRIGTATSSSSPDLPENVTLVSENSDNPTTLRTRSGPPHPAITARTAQFASDTGQLHLDTAAASMKAVTPRGEHFVLPPNTTLAGDIATATTAATPCTLNILSVDDASLTESRRILILHLTDVLPTGMQFSGEDRRELQTRGTLPHLVSRGTLTLILRLPPASPTSRWKAWVVDTAGHRQHEIPLTASNDGTLNLELASITPSGTQLAYELTRD